MSDHFKQVLEHADEMARRHEQAVERHASTTNPVLKVFTGLSVRRWAAELEDTQTQAAVDLHKTQLQTGEMPMFED